MAKAAHEVVQAAQDAGVWVFGGGLESQRASVVATDGTVTDGPYPETKEVLGGFAVTAAPHVRYQPGLGIVPPAFQERMAGHRRQLVDRGDMCRRPATYRRLDRMWEGPARVA